ncbi:hypothetical protein BGZ65_004130 [Modicella reniformis]|uniref:DUF159-domain-containing protein n=1 Tax=Modicella reniformis TaxID=1440133 RepID=A0A9P6M925_9FUNG|nr:hypothetical protein BGZ65_004130 [Modicella reniformis]
MAAGLKCLVEVISLFSAITLKHNEKDDEAGVAPAQIRQELSRTLPSKTADSWIGEEKYRTSYNVAPTRYQPVIRAEAMTNTYVVHLMRWGLIPRHTKAMPDSNSVLKSINARDDSLFMGPTGKAMFSHSKNHKRCILLAEGFYEWRRRGKERTPFYTKRRDGQLMLMAAIYDVAQIQGSEEPLYTYATITTNASPQLEWLHDRMPVLLPNHDQEKISMWLDPNLSWNTTLEAMLRPSSECVDIEDPTEGEGSVLKSLYALETYQVDDKVNNVRNDSPDFAKPWNSSSNKKTLNRFFLSKPTPADHHSTSSSDMKTSIKKEDHGDGQHERIETRDESQEHLEQEVKQKTGSKPTERNSEQVQVPVTMDDKSRDAELVQQSKGYPRNAPDPQSLSEEGQGYQEDQGDQEDMDLKHALELSWKEQDKHEVTKISADNKNNELRLSATNAFARDGFKTEVDSSGSVDLLERRRRKQQQEEEEMNKVLEFSRLQAIAEGHKGVDISDSTSIPQDEKVVEPLAKREQEELEWAIAASLNDAEGHSAAAASSPPLSSQESKKSISSAPSTPRKRKPDANAPPSPVSASKKGRPTQDSKITNFFQPAPPS